MGQCWNCPHPTSHHLGPRCVSCACTCDCHAVLNVDGKGSCIFKEYKRIMQAGE
jgi:hypothetical protein